MPETALQQITPDVYKQVLQSLKLRRVSLEQVQAVCHREMIKPVDIAVEVNYSAHSEQTPTSYLAFATYSLIGGSREEPFLTVQATYRVVFDTGAAVPAGFSDVFEGLNLRVTTMPFFRELVASVTGRMELPTLTLPYEVVGAKSTKPPASTRRKKANKQEAFS